MARSPPDPVASLLLMSYSAAASKLPGSGEAVTGCPSSCVRQVQQIGHGDRVLVCFQVKIGIPLFDLE